MKKQLLFLNSTLGCGGVERSLCDVLRHIDYTRYDVDLYLDSTEGGLFSQLPETVRVVYPNMDGCYGRFASVLRKLIKEKSFAKLWLRIVKMMSPKLGTWVLYLAKPLYRKYGKYDVVIVYKEGPQVQFAKHIFNADKYICWWHCGSAFVNESEFDGILDFDKIVAVSQNACDVFCEIFPNNLSKTIVIPNMVDNYHIKEMTNCCDLVMAKKVHIATIARLSPEKHLENIIPCAVELKKRGIDFVWHIVGGGMQYQYLNSLIKENDLEEIVVLEGEYSNPYPILANMHLYVHTSHIESQGLTILEAMTLGIPCVVTKANGPCEFISDGVNGLLVEKNPESLTEKVIQIIEDRTLYQKIKANTRCPEQFRPEHVMAKIEAMLEETI